MPLWPEQLIDAGLEGHGKRQALKVYGYDYVHEYTFR
jgi:hypothetical protein